MEVNSGTESEDSAMAGPSSSSAQTQIPRQQLIATAITFLNNKDVMRHPVNQKQQFLRSKGLTEDEIQIACERAGVFTADPTSQSPPNHTVVNVVPSGNNVIHQQIQPRYSWFYQLRDIVNSVAVVSGITYCVYLFYKRIIEPFLFGQRGPKRKTVDESIKELEAKVEKKLDELNVELIKVREDINKTSFQSIKGDLDAIKGLLLNKTQFANPVVPPSIPAWQLAAQSQQLTEKHDDNDSGSGSSETEVVTKNSDSSLEIM